MADHRRKQIEFVSELQSSVESQAFVLNTTNDSKEKNAHRNISQSAWNKIRLVELKKKDRLTSFQP